MYVGACVRYGNKCSVWVDAVYDVRYKVREEQVQCVWAVGEKE